MDYFKDFDKCATIFHSSNKACYIEKDMPEETLSFSYEKDGKYWIVVNTKYLQCLYFRELTIDIAMYLTAVKFYKLNRMDEYTEEV